MDDAQPAETRDSARALWAAGDYDQVATLIWDMGARLIEIASPIAGHDVLDIGAGTGNAAVPAAVAGARVTASDLTPELFDAGRRRAEEAGVEIDWLEGDAEALPFEDGSFDVLVSSVGIMFALGHQAAADEAVRVLRPGGRFAFASWDPAGGVGTFFTTIASHMPPPPEGFLPPTLWGTEGYVTELFEDQGVALEFRHETVELPFESAEHAVSLYEKRFGPVITAKAALQSEGRWDALRSDLVATFEAELVPAEDGAVYPAEYLVAIGTKSG